MTIKDTLKKGSVEMILLELLAKEGDLYGYQMTQMVSTLTDDYLNIPEGSMYPTLYKLEDNGYISSKKIKVGKRMTRVYYHIENSGIVYLETIRKEFYAVHDAIHKILSYKPDHERINVPEEKD